MESGSRGRSSSSGAPTEAITFLFRGGTDGLAKTWRQRGLVRWLFHVYPRFPVPPWVLPVLALTLLAICGLIVLNAAVPIVGLAALARAQELGFREFLLKPYGLQGLGEVVHRALNA